MGCNGFLKLQCLLRACAWPVWRWTLAWEPVWWHYLLAHWCVPAPQPPGACAAGGKIALRGAPALPCTLRPCSGYPSAKAVAGNTWVLACGRRDPLGVLSQAGACSDPGAEICAPSTLDVKKMSPACVAKPNSVHETRPDRGRHIPTPEEKELGFVHVPAQCSLSHCVVSPSSPPGCWVMLTALPWLGSLQTSRDAGERPLHPQQEGTCAPHVSGSGN